MLEHVPAGFTVTVTASPDEGPRGDARARRALSPTMATRPCPHVSARLVRDEAHLSEIVARLGEHGITRRLRAGRRRRSSCGLLRQRAVTSARPRGARAPLPPRSASPAIRRPTRSSTTTSPSRRCGTSAATPPTSSRNMCFDAATLEAVDRQGAGTGGLASAPARPRRPGRPHEAAHDGLAGSASPSPRGTSAVIRRWMVRLGAPGGYSPTRLLERLGPTLVAEPSAIEGLHVFTFNQLGETERWRKELLEQIAGIEHLAPVGGGRRRPDAGGAGARLSLRLSAPAARPREPAAPR